MPRRSPSTTSEPPFKPSMPSTTTPTASIPTLMTRRSPLPPKSRCDGPRHPAHHQPGARARQEPEPLQGSFIIEELTDLVEEAVLPSSTGSTAGECWERWSGNTSAPRSRRNPTTSSRRRPAPTPSSGSTPSSPRRARPLSSRAPPQVHRRGQGSPDRQLRLPGAESRDRPSSPRGAAESGDRRRQRVRPTHGDGQSGPWAR